MSSRSPTDIHDEIVDAAIPEFRKALSAVALPLHQVELPADLSKHQGSVDHIKLDLFARSKAKLFSKLLGDGDLSAPANFP